MNNIVKLLNNTKRGYDYRRYDIDYSTGYTYLSNAIKEEIALKEGFITLKSKGLCKSMEEYNLQFLNL